MAVPHRWRPPEVVLLGTLILTLAAFGAVVTSGPGEEEARASLELYRTLDVPGLGRAVDLSRCAAAFDPRLGSPCELRYGPLPGTQALCPDHTLPPRAETRRR